ncbi:MAG TPA: radical SAM protein [Candidatus Deferrimicrobium sp.]|nr:radical SAM protein [Candidatus Deferrimicrobium sp.]
MDEIISLLSSVTRVSREQAEAFMMNYLREVKDFLVEGMINDKYQPYDFIMPKSSVDMSHFRLKTPLSLVLLLTYRCSSHCLYCYANRDSREDLSEMGLAFAKAIVDQACDSKVQVMYLGGGDPFTRRWVFDLIEYINSKDIILILSTKEYLTPNMCFRLADSGVLRMQVSIDSLKPESTEMLVGRKGYVAEAIHTIGNLQLAGITVSTNSVVTKYNVMDIPELVKYLVSAVIENIVLSRYYRSTYRHCDSLFVDDSDIAWLNDQIDKINKHNAIVATPRLDSGNLTNQEKFAKFLSRARCAFGRMGLVITPSGKVIPCEQLPSKEPFLLGDLSKTTLNDVWQSDKVKSLLYPEKSYFLGRACYECEHYVKCVHEMGWCVRDVYKVYGSAWGIHPLCPKSNHNVRLR